MAHVKSHNGWITAIVSLLLFCLLCWATGFTVYADPSEASEGGDDGLGTLYVYVECYDDITMYNDDVFELTVQNAETEEETTYTISASDETAKENGYTVDAVGYSFVSLTYLGNNDDILEQGYGVQKTLSVYDGEDESSAWVIYVGESGIEELLSFAPSAYVIDDEHDENGESIYKTDKYGNVYIETTDEDGNYIIEYVNGVKQIEEEEDEESETSTYTNNEDGSDTYNADEWDVDEIGTQEETDQDYIVEHYDEEETEESSNITGNIVTIVVLVVVIGVVAVAAYFIFKKRINN